MSTPPQVSVIIPVYNGEKTINRALESVVAQTFSDFEIIVVDDHSADQSVNTIWQWGSERLSLIQHPINRGAAAARNSGILAARGRWIAFLDSDDSWKEQKLARQVALLEQARPNIAACATGYHLHKDGRELTISLNLSPKGFRREILFGCAISPGTTLLVERRMFDELGFFDEGFRRLEDWDWLLHFSERYDLAFVPEPLADVYLTTQKSSQMANGADPELSAIHRISMKHLSRLESWTEKMQLQSSLLVERAAMLHRRGRSFAAAFFVVVALIVYPARNAAFFCTLWRSVGRRVRR